MGFNEQGFLGEHNIRASPSFGLSLGNIQESYLLALVSATSDFCDSSLF